MHSHKIDAFLSCSFSPPDQEVIDFFRTIAEALDIRLINVSGASTSVPPSEAAKKIDSSSLLIAICTKRDELTTGKFVMPQAVQDEISIAFGKDVPILMFIEEGVEAVGFKSNYGTYQGFQRAKLLELDFIKQAISAIHTAKLRAVGDEDSVTQAGLDDAVAEYVHHLVELKPDSEDFSWSYSTQKKIIYSVASKRPFPSGVWPTVKARCGEIVKEATWECRVLSSSNGITIKSEIEKKTADCIEVLLKPEPHPVAGDFIEYATYCTSRYINAVWKDEVDEEVYVHLDEGDFECADGLVFIHRAKIALIEFRFPETYGLSEKDFHPFVGSYTTRVDYLVPSELARTTIEKISFAGNVSIKLKVESPLPGHIYGIAWHPKVRPAR